LTTHINLVNYFAIQLIIQLVLAPKKRMPNVRFFIEKSKMIFTKKRGVKILHLNY